jgi:hypothetical protein
VLRKAAKQHRCCWCGQKIERGELYYDQRVVNDEAGCVDTQRWHLECSDACVAIAREEGGCYYFTWGENERPRLGGAT